MLKKLTSWAVTRMNPAIVLCYSYFTIFFEITITNFVTLQLHSKITLTRSDKDSIQLMNLKSRRICFYTALYILYITANLQISNIMA